MKTSRSIALAAFLTMTAGCTASAFNLDDAARMTTAVTGTPTTSAGVLGNSQTATLINTLAALNVTPMQALGGTGALLGLAKSQLQETAYAQLAQSVPGLENLTGSNALNQASALGSLLGQSPGMTQASELLANVNSMNDVNQTFSALGMQPTMVGQFTPVLLQYLGAQGASAPPAAEPGGRLERERQRGDPWPSGRSRRHGHRAVRRPARPCRSARVLYSPAPVFGDSAVSTLSVGDSPLRHAARRRGDGMLIRRGLIKASMGATSAAGGILLASVPGFRGSEC